jgi:hypothetical protein
MTHRRLRSALSGRGFMVVPAAAFAVHQLRYQLGYGSRADQALAAQGHGYLDSLAPWVGMLLALALGSFLLRVARSAAGRPDPRPRRAFARLWLATSAGLLAVYSAQEALEGVFAAGHPGGLEGIFGHGGWWAAALAVAFGLVVAGALRIASAVVELVSSVEVKVLALDDPEPVRALRVLGRRRSVLAGSSAGRAPPKAFLAVA